jgi:hypothetical protein
MIGVNVKEMARRSRRLEDGSLDSIVNGLF